MKTVLLTPSRISAKLAIEPILPMSVMVNGIMETMMVFGISNKVKYLIYFTVVKQDILNASKL